MSLARLCTFGLNHLIFVQQMWLKRALALPRNSRACWIAALTQSGSSSSFPSSSKAATNGPAVSSIKFCKCDSSRSSSNESFLTTPSIMVLSLGHLVASLLNFVSQVLRVLLSAGFLSAKASSRKAWVDSSMVCRFHHLTTPQRCHPQ